MALGDVIARLSVVLDLNSSAFAKGSKQAQAQAESLGKKMTRIAGVIGTAFVASIGVDTVRAWADATKGALEFAGSLGETSQQLGVTTDDLQEFRYVATQTGIEQGQMDKALQKITRTLGELATPTKAQTEAMEQLGLSAKELEGLGTGDFVTLLADKFKGLTATEQAALGAQLGFGKSFQTLIPLLNLGAEALQKMRDEAQRLGIVISQSAIENADKNADLLATYEQIATAQKNATLTIPENVKAYIEYRKTIDALQIGFYKAIAGLNEFNERSKAWDQAIRDFGKNSGMHAFFAEIGSWTVSIKDISAAFSSFGAIVGRVVTEIQKWVGVTLGDVWDMAMRKVRQVGKTFQWLYDAVVGHSYVPDMVDGIAAHMARLDAVMTKPVTAATTAAEEAFRDLASNALSILDRLFPEIARRASYARERAALAAAGAGEAALRALANEFDVATQSGRPDLDLGGTKPLTAGMDNIGERLAALADKAKINTVKIAKSFKDMADDTLASLSRLTSAIKGGGFLDILSAVIGLGLQLGGTGAFGKTIAGRINSVPGYAGGTSFHGGGLAMVGERGPELVSMPRGSRVTPNSALGSMVQIVPSPYFDVVVDGRAARIAGPLSSAAATSGSVGAQTALARRQARRFP